MCKNPYSESIGNLFPGQGKFEWKFNWAQDRHKFYLPCFKPLHGKAFVTSTSQEALTISRKHFPMVFEEQKVVVAINYVLSYNKTK